MNLKTKTLDFDRKAVLSFSSLFLGWGVAFIGYWIYIVDIRGSYVTDFEFMLFWPLLYIFVFWFAFVLPTLSWIAEDSNCFKNPWAFIYGFFYGILGYLVLMSLSFHIYSVDFIIFAGAVSGFGNVLYSHLKRIFVLFNYPHLFWFVPVILFFGFQYLFWPASEKFLPGTAYKYGTRGSQNRILTNQLQTIKEGDSWQTFKQKMPYYFKEPFGGSGSWVGNLGESCFRIHLKEYRVVKINYWESCPSQW